MFCLSLKMTEYFAIFFDGGRALGFLARAFFIFENGEKGEKKEKGSSGGKKAKSISLLSLISPSSQKRLPPPVQLEVLAHPRPQQLELSPHVVPQQAPHRVEVARGSGRPNADAGGRDGRRAERGRRALELMHGGVDERRPGRRIAVGFRLLERLGEPVELLGRVGEVERRDLADKVGVRLVLLFF